ncbi:sigma-70 family RNA polymerase sigma factor [Streptomyces atratus]|uniref:RNA polymerase sigma factor, sigma-70 family n=1 Tax=Streptomyces atratus TaxID=1893 RepID=A0A1K2EG20_STRAR|nr:sigma-70 family RNA polymerase sigma factor [Streptomyces atratus]SFY34537.1 RNA polymerase sigma factor, sigma-70 family [Streptomyces atratus]
MADFTWPGEQLIAAAQEGDVEAAAALVSGSHPHVQRFAHSLCASPQDAEDAAQEALIILYRKIGMLRASGALASWMFRIVRNECLRRARLMLRSHGPVPDIVMPSFEDEVLQRLEASRVATAIAALPADQRRVLIMRDIQGHSGRMVADALGLSTAAMKSRLHRARTEVRRTLQGMPDPLPGAGHD